MNRQKSLATKNAKAAVSNPSVPSVPPAVNTQTVIPGVQKLPEKRVVAAKLPDPPRTAGTYSIPPQTQEQTKSLRGKGEDTPAVEIPVENQKPVEVKTVDAPVTQPIKAAADTASAEGNDVLKSRIAADVAAKRPMRDIINEACKSGMSVDEVVGCMIKAGADTQSVVYIAISEGYPPDKIVKGAIKADAPLDIVMNAGISEGADSKTLCRGAIEAGVFPSACASASSSAGTSGTPVYGYSSPAAAPLTTMYAPVAPIMIGGGGGGTTKKASPSKP
jgi:hypothetical protein